MSTLLEKIVDNKRQELEKQKHSVPLEILKDQIEKTDEATRGFAAAITACESPAIIAELKKASPTKGLLRPSFDVERLAEAYSKGGAAALSVLTESKFFLGDLSFIRRARAVSGLPVLRKDFIFDPYQIFEARAAGADAVLLIAASLEKSLLSELLDLAHSLTLDALVEVHDGDELSAVSGLPCDVIGVNNRNLKTGQVSIETSITLSSFFPASVCKISESGIKDSNDIKRLKTAGYNGFLIGETLVVSDDPEVALSNLIKESR